MLDVVDVSEETQTAGIDALREGGSAMRDKAEGAFEGAKEAVKG